MSPAQYSRLVRRHARNRLLGGSLAKHPPGSCAAIAGVCVQWRGVPMDVCSPAPGGTIPSGSGTQSQAPASRSCKTLIIQILCSMTWLGVRMDACWLVGPTCKDFTRGIWQPTHVTGLVARPLPGFTTWPGVRTGHDWPVVRTTASPCGTSQGMLLERLQLASNKNA